MCVLHDASRTVSIFRDVENIGCIGLMALLLYRWDTVLCVQEVVCRSNEGKAARK